MHRIVFLDRATLAPQIKLRRPAFAHEWIEYETTSEAEAKGRLAGATIALVNKVPLGADLLGDLPALKLIAVAATGTDCVDKAAASAARIAVTNIRHYASNTVPEHTFALILALRRNIVLFREDVLRGEWQKAGQFCFFNHPIRDLAGSRLGIVGEGVLGQRVADLGRAFGMLPLFAAHKGVEGLGPLYTPWDEVMETADVITLHAPLTPATRGMIGMPEFRRMKRQPLIINTARGGLIIEEALERALDEGLVSGAGLDVTCPNLPLPTAPLCAWRNIPRSLRPRTLPGPATRPSRRWPTNS